MSLKLSSSWWKSEFDETKSAFSSRLDLFIKMTKCSPFRGAGDQVFRQEIKDLNSKHFSPYFWNDFLLQSTSLEPPFVFPGQKLNFCLKWWRRVQMDPNESQKIKRVRLTISDHLSPLLKLDMMTLLCMAVSIQNGSFLRRPKS